MDISNTESDDMERCMIWKTEQSIEGNNRFSIDLNLGSDCAQCQFHMGPIDLCQGSLVHSFKKGAQNTLIFTHPGQWTETTFWCEKIYSR